MSAKRKTADDPNQDRFGVDGPGTRVPHSDSWDRLWRLLLGPDWPSDTPAPQDGEIVQVIENDYVS
ncbi:MAG: hypothetical protein ACREDR_04025 [Blastocatellia bacterium]